MPTLVDLSPGVKYVERNIGDYLVRIYNSSELITFYSTGQRIKRYKALVQTVLNGKEMDLIGYYDQLSEAHIEEQFQIIEKNVKKKEKEGQ